MHKAVFLDRDGVINEVLTSRVRFVNKDSDFHLLDKVGEAVKLLNGEGFKIFVVTNQGGVGLGYMTEKSLESIHKKMKADLARHGAAIDDVVYCPHKPHAGCACRKPEPEMLLRLAERYGVDLRESYMIGDRAADIEAGRKAGTRTILVGDRQEEAEADFYFTDLYETALFLCNR